MHLLGSSQATGTPKCLEVQGCGLIPRCSLPKVEYLMCTGHCWWTFEDCGFVFNNERDPPQSCAVCLEEVEWTRMDSFNPWIPVFETGTSYHPWKFSAKKPTENGSRSMNEVSRALGWPCLCWQGNANLVQNWRSVLLQIWGEQTPHQWWEYHSAGFPQGCWFELPYFPCVCVIHHIVSFWHQRTVWNFMIRSGCSFGTQMNDSDFPEHSGLRLFCFGCISKVTKHSEKDLTER